MKKIILTVAAVFAFGFANAQDAKETSEGFSQGDVYFSGSLGFNSTKQDEAKENNVTFSPSAAYFVSPNIAIGARLTVESGKVENGPVETKTSAFGADVFGRYYFTPTSKFSTFAELAAGFGSDKSEDALGNETKFNGFGVNAGFGVSYFLNSNFAIEAGWAGLGYNSRKQDVSGAEARNTFDLTIDMSSINFGLIYKL